MNIVLYSDSNYEYQVKNFIKSLSYGGIENYKIIYYTIGFVSSIDDLRVIKIPYTKNPIHKRFEFYKPEICLDALKYGSGTFYFFDTDIILSKRFKSFDPIIDITYPIFCTGPIEYPYTYFENESGGRTIFNEKRLMDYLGVEERSMFYVMTCFFTYDEKSIDFLEEWQSFCENRYLLKESHSWYAFTDETIANVLLWKRKCTINYGRRFVNTHKFSTFKICEETNNLSNILIDDNIYEQCEDSSKVYFYHAVKVQEENNKILNYIYENS